MFKATTLQSHLKHSASLLLAPRGQLNLRESVDSAVQAIVRAFDAGKPLLTCGKGGSASDVLHISGEHVGRFRINRSALNVVRLNSNVTVITAWARDSTFDSIFSRQVQAHESEGGVLLGAIYFREFKKRHRSLRNGKKIRDVHCCDDWVTPAPARRNC